LLKAPTCFGLGPEKPGSGSQLDLTTDSPRQKARPRDLPGLGLQMSRLSCYE
jgi:hypothetical protein